MMSNSPPQIVSKESGSVNSDKIYEEIPKSQMKMSLPNSKHDQSNSTFKNEEPKISSKKWALKKDNYDNSMSIISEKIDQDCSKS